MRTRTVLGGAVAFAVLVAGCEAMTETTAPESAPQPVAAALVTDLELTRPRIDVTGWEDLTTTIAAELLTPEAASGIGTGSALLITIPDEGRFGCTANFVWESGGDRFLGAAGHCFLPADRSSTHGEGADYDARGVRVQVCVENCEGNFRTNQLTGTWMDLGRVRYARQAAPNGDQVGHDFGVVEIRGLPKLIRLSMPVWGGPTGTQMLASGDLGCHYGHGLGVGEVFLTKARTGLGGGGEREYWMGDFAGAFGDSGSGMVGCESDGVTLSGTGAVGVLTHLGVQVCPCSVNINDQTFTAEQGVIFGTTVERAIEMGREAGLDLTLLLP